MKLKKIISLALTLMMSSTLLVGCGQSKKSAEVLNIYNVGDYIDEDLIKRQALHAYSLKFQQPRTREDLEFKAPLPRDMEELIEKLS